MNTLEKEAERLARAKSLVLRGTEAFWQLYLHDAYRRLTGADALRPPKKKRPR